MTLTRRDRWIVLALLVGGVILFALGFLCGVTFGGVRPAFEPTVETEEVERPLSVVIPPNPASTWRKLHSGMCCTLPLSHGGFRMWLTGRESLNRGFAIGWLDLDARLHVIDEAATPCLTPNPEPGRFDSFAVFMPCVIPHGDELRMYYAAASEAPFVQHGAPGVAISRDDGKTWERRSDPLLTPLGTPDEISIGTVFVLAISDQRSAISKENADPQPEFRLYYTAVDEELRYAIRVAESSDGLSFRRGERFEAFNERPLVTSARPFVWRVADGWLMLFAHNRLPDGDRPGSSYRIHLARSADGIQFTDAGELVGAGPAGSFDAHQCEYAWLDSGLLFYSGDGYGATGIGIVDFRDRMIDLGGRP